MQTIQHIFYCTLIVLSVATSAGGQFISASSGEDSSVLHPSNVGSVRMYTLDSWTNSIVAYDVHADGTRVRVWSALVDKSPGHTERLKPLAIPHQWPTDRQAARKAIDKRSNQPVPSERIMM